MIEPMTEAAARACHQLEGRLAGAESALTADAASSPVLGAVVAEFRRKFAKTRPAIEGAADAGRREAIVELEQAADSAKWAALADPDAAVATKLAIVAAHDTICWFKATGAVLDREHIEPDPLGT